jgi:hypothetical protein
MSPPPRRISANTPTNMPSLSSKYPQIRKADPQRKLFDTNEESLLNDLDDTTENEKLRKQIFKLNRVINFIMMNDPQAGFPLFPNSNINIFKQMPMKLFIT